MKEENKQTEKLSEAVLFDGQLIKKISFDLLHINEGWDDEKSDYAYKNRSSYKAQDIVEFFEQFKYISVEWELGESKNEIKIKGKDYFRYVFDSTDEKGKAIRVVVDLPKKYTGEGIIVTVFNT